MAELEAEIWVLGHDRTLDDVDRKVFDLVVEMDMPILASEKRRDELTVALDPPRIGRMGEHLFAGPRRGGRARPT